MTAQEEAKQLDSVTDRVTEQDSMDASKAKDAMASLASRRRRSAAAAAEDNDKKLAKIEVSKEDIAVIVDELEVTDDKAEQALKMVIAKGLPDGTTALGEALGMLITS